MRKLSAVLFLFLCGPALSQENDSVFSTYGDYSKFVDSRIMSRNFIELIQVLGGRDEYTPEQLQGLDNRFRTIYPADFTDGAVTRQVDLGNGFGQEMRIFWDSKFGYIYFYAFLHNRGSELIVLNFTLNSNVAEVLSKF